MKDKFHKSWIILLLFLILLAVFYTAIILTNSRILEIIGLGISLFLFCFHSYYIVENQSIWNQSQNSISAEEGSLTTSPLDGFALDRIRKQNRLVVTKEALEAEWFYEISQGNIVLEHQVFYLNPKKDYQKLTNGELLFLETLFLEEKDYRKNKDMRKNRLLSMQKMNVGISKETAQEQMMRNSQLPTMRELFLDIQKEYLEDETNHWIAIVTILSGFLAILEVILSIASIQEATLYNFYLPLMSAILLLAVIFHKNHERMIFKKEKQKELGAFMYHCYQQKDLYAYACDGLTLEEKNQIQKDFQLE